MKKLLNFNEEIKELLRENKIPIEEGLCVLVLKYYELKTKHIPIDFVNKINALNIYNKNYKDNILDWRLPLFENTITGNWEWLQNFQDLYVNKNPLRTASIAKNRQSFKMFFKNYPYVTTDVILSVTEKYLNTTQEGFVMKSCNFIMNENNSTLYNLISREVKQYNKYIDNERI